jgi:hypothetical protein
MKQNNCEMSVTSFPGVSSVSGCSLCIGSSHVSAERRASAWMNNRLSLPGGFYAASCAASCAATCATSTPFPRVKQLRVLEESPGTAGSQTAWSPPSSPCFSYYFFNATPRSEIVGTCVEWHISFLRRNRTCFFERYGLKL